MADANAPLYQPTIINVFNTSPGAFAPAIGLFSPSYTASSGSFTGIDPGLFTSALLAFQSAGQANLATVTNEAAGLYEGNASLFSTWAGYQNQFMQTTAQAFADAESKSATACSGFFSCLFG